MTKSMNNMKPASPKMGGGGYSVRNNKMTGGSKSMKTKKSNLFLTTLQTKY